MKLILLGAPGSGKGTQAEKIAEMTGVMHVSSGDLSARLRRMGPIWESWPSRTWRKGSLCRMSSW